MDVGPTFKSELLRGVNPYNLTVGVLSALAAGGVVFFLTWYGVFPDLLQKGTGVQALSTFVGVFFFITGLHTAAHAYFGWRFQRGIQASQKGQHHRAIQLLTIVEAKGMSHYDENGIVQKTLQTSRAAQEVSK